MAKKTSTKTSSQTRTAAASKPGKTGNKASVSAAFAKRTASSITGDIRSLAAEVKDLRSLRAKYDQLLVEHHGLVGALRELSTELAGSARSAWKQYRAGGKGSMTSMTSSSTLMGRPRVRAASAEVDAMTAKLLASLPTAWSAGTALPNPWNRERRRSVSWNQFALIVKRNTRWLPAATPMRTFA